MGSKKQEKSKALIPRWLHCSHALLHLQPEPYIALARTRNCAITPQGWGMGVSAPGQRPTAVFDPDHGFQGGGCRFSGGHAGLARCHFWHPQPTRQGYSPGVWRHHFSLGRVAEETASSLAE